MKARANPNGYKYKNGGLHVWVDYPAPEPTPSQVKATWTDRRSEVRHPM